MIDRRSLLIKGGIGAAALSFAPRMVLAKAQTDRRFVFIIQRGAADGLGTVAAMGDPAFAGQRGVLAADFATGTRLDSMFTLHPAMQNFARLYGEKQALFAHAIASPYRDRSHFDGQNVLETGGAAAYQLKDGWLNRLLGVLPAEQAHAIAVAAAVPMALRGHNDVSSYAPSALPHANDDMLQRVTMMYDGDSQLHALWSEAMATRALTSDIGRQAGNAAVQNGSLAAKLLAPANGARIAMIESYGWDTHVQQRGILGAQLRYLDGMVGALQAGLGPVWNDTTVLIATEFGRTVAINGTGGTDHGTGTSAILVGGAVKGGRVLADWPGLNQAVLYENRDLKPTAGLDQFIAGAVAEHFAIDPVRTIGTLFPDSKGAKPMAGLVQA